jgi:hypothetical protein
VTAIFKLVGDDEKKPSRAEVEYSAGQNSLRLRRHSLYRDWRPEVVPTVTLKQAAWLLLGLDPNQFDPGQAHYRTLRKKRYRELMSTLEYAVGAHKLKAVGKPVQGTARRFRLVEIAETAIQQNVAMNHAQEILTVFGDQTQPRTRNERADARRRWELHRKFVKSLGPLSTPVSAKYKTSNRRRNVPHSLNRKVELTGRGYNGGIRKFCKLDCPDMLAKLGTNAVLDQDRWDLNIQVKRGRPAKPD